MCMEKRLCETFEKWPCASKGEMSQEKLNLSTLIIDFQLQELCKKFCCLSHRICGIFLWWQPQQSNILNCGWYPDTQFCSTDLNVADYFSSDFDIVLVFAMPFNSLNITPIITSTGTMERGPSGLYCLRPGSQELTCSAADQNSIPGLGRSPGEGHGNPLQHSCLENSMERGAWWAMGYGVTKSQAWLIS